ncbi:DUF805 domain-containing protein [Phycicoccus flavus]|uniref:DUF805 domain-containing protein n=1 Tax=Phycicoccus flavus TaxID=2502783 RepID=UPI000FEC08A8|nr:DUF805 domain-containing protein [Phycicoccus flavus]NHA68181.1 DUF805 domain-containing protein [Phycicoccus flavus]
MSFVDAVKTCFAKYVGFSGRARRSEYWWWVLFTSIVGIVALIIDVSIGTRTDSGVGIVQSILGLALLLPNLAVSIRRLHDTSRSGWWILLGFIPLIGAVILIVFYVQDSHGDNQYGPNPKHEVARV